MHAQPDSVRVAYRRSATAQLDPFPGRDSTMAQTLRRYASTAALGSAFPLPAIDGEGSAAADGLAESTRPLALADAQLEAAGLHCREIDHLSVVADGLTHPVPPQPVGVRPISTAPLSALYTAQPAAAPFSMEPARAAADAKIARAEERMMRDLRAIPARARPTYVTAALAVHR
jgi:hypothetical protein